MEVNKLEDFKITAEQTEAFHDVIHAMKKCQRLGLVFYGKQDGLTAYSNKAFVLDLVAELDDDREKDYLNDVPCISEAILSTSRRTVSDSEDDCEFFKHGVLTP